MGTITFSFKSNDPPPKLTQTLFFGGGVGRFIFLFFLLHWVPLDQGLKYISSKPIGNCDYQGILGVDDYVIDLKVFMSFFCNPTKKKPNKIFPLHFYEFVAVGWG